MAGYVDLDGVNTWYDEHGAGEPLVLLHPGGVDSRAFAPNLDALAARFRVFTPERRAHGRTQDVDGPLSYELMADDTAAFIEKVIGEPAHVVGCSDGGCVALLTALRHPGLVRRLVDVSGVFHHDGWLPGVLDFSADDEAFFAAGYAELSPDGPEHYPVVAAKLAEMHAGGPALTTAELAGITCRTLIMVGDDDELRPEHVFALYHALPDGELAVVPGTSHGLLVEKPDLCHRLIVDFLTTAPVPTYAPIHRAAPSPS
jgi:pimeloyl-ACP methyl ester carboxylesterase